MAASTLSARMLITSHLTDASGLSIFRHRLPPTPVHALLDKATASQLFVATIFNLKTVSACGNRQLFKGNNIVDLLTSLFLTLNFYCFMTFLAFHTKTITSFTAYALGLAISLVMILETYNTMYALMLRLELTLEHIRIVGTYMLNTTYPSGLVIPSVGIGPNSGLDHGYSPEVDSTQKENNAAKTQQRKKELYTSSTTVQLYNDLSPEDHCTLKEDKNTKRHQEKTITYVLDAPQQTRSKPQPTTYKILTPSLDIDSKPNMQTAEIYISRQTPAIQPSESPFQMSLRNSMHRSRRPSRTIRSRMSTSVNSSSNSDSYFNEGFRMTVCSEDESSERNSGTSTPDSSSECSISTMESDFQTRLRMMLGSACGKSKRGRKDRRGGPYIVEMSQESEFQCMFREVVWPGVGVAVRGG